MECRYRSTGELRDRQLLQITLIFGGLSGAAACSAGRVDNLVLLDERYGSVSKFAPLLLANFEFCCKALDLVRDLNARGKQTLPENVPTGFIKLR